MNNTKSSDWFKGEFNELDPLLRKLHIHGGELAGPVDINIATGVAGIIGKQIAVKLGIPINKGEHTLRVSITHKDDGLHWDRCFDKDKLFKSTFTPTGTIGNGYWIESTGSIHLRLTVDIKNGGWYWRTLQAKLKGFPLPLWLFPKTTAYKVIENNLYRFYVGISLPVFGEVISYSGLLSANLNT